MILALVNLYVKCCPSPYTLYRALVNQFIHQLLLQSGSGVLQINGREKSVLTALESAYNPYCLLFIQHTLLMEICSTQEYHLSGW